MVGIPDNQILICSIITWQVLGLHTDMTGKLNKTRPIGAHVTILTGMPVLFWGFEIWPNPIFLAGQIFQLLFWVLRNFCYFFGSDKFPTIFLGLPIFV